MSQDSSASLIQSKANIVQIISASVPLTESRLILKGHWPFQDAGRNTNRDKYNAYGASKTAVNAFTVMLANELREEKISVNSVTPGYTATDLNQNQGAKTAEQGAWPIVKLVTESNPAITAKFFKDGGEVLW
jgi:NAD(P)-dependent dehydrogenase (short-subunit alcohol dehydrogenase family)